MDPDSYREFQYPLNVFMLILSREEGDVPYLHYGLFESEDEPIGRAQERSTELLLEQLPPPPARILDVGIGVGTTLARLGRLGYDAVGITPDQQQVDTAKRKFGNALQARCERFESFVPNGNFDAVVFQESAQYIPPVEIFSRSAAFARRVVVLDEFASRTFEQAGWLHLFSDFVRTAGETGWTLELDRDLSALAAPTVSYFMRRIPSYREAIRDALGLPDARIDDLLRSGAAYVAAYEAGDYSYRLLVFDRRPE